VLEWSDDDEDLVAPPPSTQAPPSSTYMEEQPRGSEEIPKHQAIEVPAGQATVVLEQQAELNPVRWAEETPEEQRPIVEEARPSLQSMRVDTTTTPRVSGRHCRFKKLHR